MSGNEKPMYDNPKLSGWWRYFNSVTLRGRANVAKATYATIFLTWLAYKLYNFNSCDKSTNALTTTTGNDIFARLNLFIYERTPSLKRKTNDDLDELTAIVHGKPRKTDDA